MGWDDLKRSAEHENQRDRDRWIGIYIAILAVLLAICSMGGGNAAKDANAKNIDATNTWAFFQAKNMRRHVLRVQADEMELKLASEPQMPEAARAAVEAKIKSYKEQDAKLTSDPKSGEGLDELFAKGKALEADRDRALKKDPYFDYGEALLQIAIVLASVSIVLGGTMLLIGSVVLGALGTVLAINGFTLMFALPLLG